MSRCLPVVLALLLASPAAAQESGATVAAPESGFELTIPDVGWAHRVQRSGEMVSLVAVGPEAAGGLIQLAVQVTVVSESDLEAARAQVRELRAMVAGQDSITDVEDLELEIAGTVAPGLQLNQAALGQEFHVRLVFLRARGFQYRIQFHAPRDQFDAQWVIAREVLAGFRLIELDAAARERVRLRDLASRCGSLVQWAADWDEAAQRARREGRLIVVSVFAQPGFDLGNRLDEGVFMSREVIELMNHRFVGWRWSAGQAAPFVDHDVFGLSGTTFGVGLLVCTPDGEVVNQVFLVDPVLAADALRASLREHPDRAPPPAPPSDDPDRRVAFLIDSGQLEAARVILGEPDERESRAAAFQRARLHRVERDGAAALRALEAAGRGTPSGSEHDPTPARLLIEEATVQIGLGHNELAAAALQRCLEGEPDATTQAEAMFLQGLLARADGDVERTKARWTALTRELPDEPPAWVAAAGLLGPALEIDIQPDLSWPPESAERMSRVPPPARATSVLEVAPALTEAIDWLLAAQRSDGGWDVPYGSGINHPAPDHITMAIQAICLQALVRAADAWRHDDPARATRCRDAAIQALRRYLDDRALQRAHPRPVAFMDYTCWGSSYGLFGLTTVLDPEGGLAEALPSSLSAAAREEAARLVDDLLRIQAPNGGWSYYISGQVDGTSSGVAMSFTSATVLLALHAATQHGLDVPGDMLQRGVACLASMRGTNGVFEYMRPGAGPHTAGEVRPDGAAARGPVCTLALLRGGRLDAEAMKPAFLVYVEHLGSFGAEARKALMHAGPDGQGSHYLLYDYSTAAEALRATAGDDLDAATRNLARSAILRELDRCRNADGSFVDNPIIGCAAGTGLAALTLIDLLLDSAVPP